MNTNDITKVFVNWKDIENYCQDIVNKIKDLDFKYDCILSVGRGGLIPSGLISEKLNLQHIEIFNCHSYTNINCPGAIQSLSFDYNLITNKNLLIVDDVYTTGTTMDYVCNHISNNVDEIFMTTCSLFLNKEMKELERNPDLWSQEYDSAKEWLVFPWEEDEDRK